MGKGGWKQGKGSLFPHAKICFGEVDNGPEGYRAGDRSFHRASRVNMRLGSEHMSSSLRHQSPNQTSSARWDAE